MPRFLLIFSVLFGACNDVADSPVVPTEVEKLSIKAIDLTRLNPETVDISIFDNPHLQEGVIFQNLYSAYSGKRRFLVRNTSEEKGFYIWTGEDWKRHGNWFISKTGIVQNLISYKSGVLHGRYTEYDSFGSIVSTGRYRDGKKRFTFEDFDSELTGTASCYDYFGEPLTCCPVFRCGQARRYHHEKVYGR